MAKMDAVVLREHGGPEVLTYESIDKPEPGARDVRVAIKAVAMNHLDLWVRRGSPAFHLEYPHRLGADISGVVDAVGAEVEGLEVGQKVVVNPGISCGHCKRCLAGDDNLCRDYGILGEHGHGGYAQFIVVPRQNIAPFPGELSFEKAAAGLLTFMTSWQMLVKKARIEPGQLILVHGAGSGVGVAALQIARLFNCRVIATAGTDAKLEKAKELGAEFTINYREADFVAEVKAITKKAGVDVVFEHVGGETFAKSIKVTRNGGRIVTCGATSGFKPAIDLRHVFFRQIEILGSTMGSKADLLQVLEHIAAGHFDPIVHEVLPLRDAAKGHVILEERKAFGKVVLTP